MTHTCLDQEHLTLKACSFLFWMPTDINTFSQTLSNCGYSFRSLVWHNRETIGWVAQTADVYLPDLETGMSETQMLELWFLVRGFLVCRGMSSLSHCSLKNKCVFFLFFQLFFQNSVPLPFLPSFLLIPPFSPLPPLLQPFLPDLLRI